MGRENPAEGFLRHRGLILAAALGAIVEDGLLTLLAPGARSVAPQVTAIPSLAAYHDLRWLFADNQSWFWFSVVVVAVLAARAALDTALLRLAWPRDRPPPAPGRAFVSCAALTLLSWLLLLPVATLAFGVAVLPFSWPFLAAFPIMLVMMAALSHGGVVRSWWRRLPPARAVCWLLGSFAAATAAGPLIGHLPSAAGLAVTAVIGLVNARAWYSLARLAARRQPRPLASVPARVVFGLPFAPLSGLAVFAALVVVARLLLMGVIQLPLTQSPTAASLAGVGASASAGTGTGAGTAADSAALPAVTASATLVVAGFGSSCCDAANSLRAEMPGAPLVRQFSYVGLDARGDPVRSGIAATDISLPALGDKIADQVQALHARTGRPVAVVAESEGTLGVYAMLARHPGLPVSAIALLSPIVSPDQLGGPTDAGGSASGDALDELDYLVGSISSYGPAGAQALLSSVGRVGARYFDRVAAEATGSGAAFRWLAVVPLADAVTLPPDCALPADVIVVPALHGGLLGDPAVLPMVSRFLAGRTVSQTDNSMREAAEVISGASAAWRLPDTSASCPL